MLENARSRFFEGTGLPRVVPQSVFSRARLQDNVQGTSGTKATIVLVVALLVYRL